MNCSQPQSRPTPNKLTARRTSRTPSTMPSRPTAEGRRSSAAAICLVSRPCCRRSVRLRAASPVVVVVPVPARVSAVQAWATFLVCGQPRPRPRRVAPACVLRRPDCLLRPWPGCRCRQAARQRVAALWVRRSARLQPAASRRACHQAWAVAARCRRWRRRGRRCRLPGSSWRLVR